MPSVNEDGASSTVVAPSHRPTDPLSMPQRQQDRAAVVSDGMGQGGTAIGSILDALAGAGKAIARRAATSLLHRGHLRAGVCNSSGDDQTVLDMVAQRAIVDALQACGNVAIMLSEEEEGPIMAEKHAEYAVVFDPLDGSSNIMSNMPTGTIFGVFPVRDVGNPSLGDVLQTGDSMVASGYILYSSATIFVATLGKPAGVHSFIIDAATNEFVSSGPIVMPVHDPKKVVSANVGNVAKWAPGIRAFTAEAVRGPNPYSLRYVGAMVADLHRTLLEGGIFYYPADTKHKSGKLRTMYECFPTAFLVEAAGGACITGDSTGRVLDIVPTEPHCRTPIVFGSVQDVAKLAGLVSACEPAPDAKQESTPTLPGSIFDSAQQATEKGAVHTQETAQFQFAYYTTTGNTVQTKRSALNASSDCPLTELGDSVRARAVDDKAALRFIGLGASSNSAAAVTGTTINAPSAASATSATTESPGDRVIVTVSYRADLLDLGLNYVGKLYRGTDTDTLQELAIHRGEGKLSKDGVLVTTTGERTGRSAKDRFIVTENSTSGTIAWGRVNSPLSAAAFTRLRAQVVSHLERRDTLFVQDLVCGNDPTEAMPVKVVTESSWHAMFARTMFVRPKKHDVAAREPFTVLHAPFFLANTDSEPELNSGTFVVVNLASREVIIGGTQYAGEIKKAIFSVMNFELPLAGVLTMHSAANIGPDGKATLFFGLSGTGKTTLSEDPARELIGDDEHGWGANGLFNLEGGCYAKLINLSAEAEPEIYSRCHTKGAVLENVLLDQRAAPIFEHNPGRSLTENTRAAYPIEMVANRAKGSAGGHPTNVVLLTCDASGVLPPIARLTHEQAAYHFVSGYTSKTPGTEVGVTEPVPTFSACYGEAFMPLHPSFYAQLLMEKLRAHGCTTWLLNTGWTGGRYGVGNRFQIGHTRALLNAALDGRLGGAPFSTDARFGFESPKACAGVPPEMFVHPRDTWADPEAYDLAADALVHHFTENYSHLAHQMPPGVTAAAPVPAGRNRAA